MTRTQNEFRVRFSSKGQIVIPSSIRKALEIEDGTETVVKVVGDEIHMKPVTKATLRRLRGVVVKANNSSGAK